MSDSGSSFNELKDNESSAPSTSIPINTSLLHADKPLPTSVPKPAASKANFSDNYSTLFIPAPHPAFSVDWFTHYLKQTRVMVVLALFIFSLILVIWILTLGKAGAMNGSSSVTCADWISSADLVPRVVSQCPPVRAEVYYAGSAANSAIRIDGNDVSYADVSSPPMAIFVPNAPSSYYYTAILLDIDSVSTESSYSNVLAIMTNLRLGDSIDTSRAGITNVVDYSGPSSTASNAHKYVWLIYRHSQEAPSSLQANQPNRFNVEEWFASSWSQRPTIAAAAWFTARGRN